MIKLHSCNDAGVQHIYLNAPGNAAVDETQLQTTQEDGPCSELGGSVHVHQHKQQLTTDPSWENQLQPPVDTTYRDTQGQSGLAPVLPDGNSKAEGCARDRIEATDHKSIPDHLSQAPLPISGVLEDSPITDDREQPDEGMEEDLVPDNQHNQTQNRDNEDCLDFNSPDFDLGEWLDSQACEDKIAETLAERDAITIGINVSFKALTTHYGIPHELHDVYYQWLLDLTEDNRMRFNQDLIPRGRGKYLKPGLKIPAPQGPRWRELMEEKNLKYSETNKKRVIQANHMIKEAIHSTAEGIRAVEALMKHWDAQDTIEAYQAKKKRTKTADDALGKQPPKSISQAR